MKNIPVVMHNFMNYCNDGDPSDLIGVSVDDKIFIDMCLCPACYKKLVKFTLKE